MKNYIKLFLLSILFLFVSGCATSDLRLTIDKYDDVYLTHTVMFDEETYSYVQDIIDDSNKEMYKGYEVEKIIDGKSTGYKIYKKLDALHNMDSSFDDTVELNTYSNTNLDTKRMFENDNLLFVNKYIGRYSIDLTDMKDPLNSLIFMEKSIYDDSVNNDINRMNNEIETYFSLDTRYRIGDNNSTSNENGIYYWKLKYGEVNKIYFEIYKNNYGNIIMFSSIMIIVGIGYLLIKSRNDRLRRIARVSIKDSLDLEYEVSKRSERREIAVESRRKQNIRDDKTQSKIININERISNRNSTIGAYSNQKTVEKISEELNRKKEVVKKSYYDDDPDFKMIKDDDIIKTNNSVSNNIENKFIDDSKK